MMVVISILRRSECHRFTTVFYYSPSRCALSYVVFGDFTVVITIVEKNTSIKDNILSSIELVNRLITFTRQTIRCNRYYAHRHVDVLVDRHLFLVFVFAFVYCVSIYIDLNFITTHMGSFVI